jgi:hypothetical protein
MLFRAWHLNGEGWCAASELSGPQQERRSDKDHQHRSNDHTQHSTRTATVGHVRLLKVPRVERA